jgi:hypothetical protein
MHRPCSSSTSLRRPVPKASRSAAASSVSGLAFVAQLHGDCQRIAGLVQRCSPQTPLIAATQASRRGSRFAPASGSSVPTAFQPPPARRVTPRTVEYTKPAMPPAPPCGAAPRGGATLAMVRCTASTSEVTPVTESKPSRPSAWASASDKGGFPDKDFRTKASPPEWLSRPPWPAIAPLCDHKPGASRAPTLKHRQAEP